MKRASWLLIPSILLLLAFAGWWSHGPTPSPRTLSAPPSPPPLAAPPTSAIPPAGKPLPSPPPGVAPAFVAFLKADAQELNSLHVDAAAAATRLDQQASQLGAAEARYARELALNPEAPANERILAVALLANPRTSAALALSACAEIITQGMNSSRAEQHSAAELSNVQAKSFALMCVDGLADRAAKDPTAREDLQRLLSQAKDSTVQKYLLAKLRALPSP